MIDLDAIEQRLKAATPGPWVLMDEPLCEIRTAIDYRNNTGFDLIAEMSPDVDNPADFELMAHAPEDISAMLAEVRRLQYVASAELEQEREARKAAEQHLEDEAQQCGLLIDKLQYAESQWAHWFTQCSIARQAKKLQRQHDSKWVLVLWRKLCEARSERNDAMQRYDALLVNFDRLACFHEIQKHQPTPWHYDPGPTCNTESEQ